ncbi:MAG: alpha/beta hydrolase [Anaerolineales bacterium]|nr:alpha/beta hydrolase [Anaerolineales bacterium]
MNVNGIRLHYLDWGGNGPVLLFLTGMGLSAYIYNKFAPRFTDKFHVIAVTRRGHGDSDYPETGYDVDTLTEDLLQFMDKLEIDKAILAGHSMANVELCHFSALHPERILKLVFLDSAYDRTAPAFKAMVEKYPSMNLQIPGAKDDHYSIEDYVAAIKRNYPSFAAVWCDVMDEDLLHTVKKSPEGKIVDKMSDAIGQALNATLNSYTPEDSKIQCPVLNIYANKSSDYYLSPDYMTEEQNGLLTEYFDTVRPPLQRELIEQFQRSVPHAKIVEISKGHHYCFIKHEELVFDEMRKFLVP